MSRKPKAKKSRKKYILNCSRLDYLMKKYNYSNRTLAELMGANKTGICGWRRGHHNPNPKNLKKLADIFNVDITYLLEDDAQISQNYLRHAIYKTVEQDVTATDYQGFIAMMNALGLTVKDKQGNEVTADQLRETTEAEKDLMEKVLNGSAQSETPETPES